MEDMFFEEYLSKLEDYNKIPKLQIERAISPLLSIYIEELITHFLKSNQELSGPVELILPEFPLKKDNHQSTNIDWLLFNKAKGILFFVELKTSSTSFNHEQLEIYQLTQKFIRKFGAAFLYDDIKQIRNRSSEKNKYDFIIEKLSSLEEYFKSVKKSEMIYIAPTSIKSKLPGELFLPFSEFPENLNHSYTNQWKQLRKFFNNIDNPSEKVLLSRTDAKLTSDSNLGTKIKLIASRYNKTPELIWFGIMGDGSNPNFQIQFTDGTVQAFYHSGKEYKQAIQFNMSNLQGPFSVKDYL